MSHQEPPERESGAEKPEHLRSREVTEGTERAPHRAMFRAMGFDDEDLTSPMVGVANPAADVTSCNVHLDEVAESALEGIDSGGGMPIEFGTITISDAISMGTEGMKASLISPVATAPRASKTFWMVISRPPCSPGMMEPP